MANAQNPRKTAVITGSNSGIGLGIAHALAAAGHNIVINSFSNSEEDHALAAQLADDHGVEAIYVQADMALAEQCRSLVDRSAAHFGRMDIVVNNAGIQHVAPVETFPTDKWDRIIAINLTSAFHISAAAIPLMKAQGWGRIINIASAHGLRASPFKSAYVAAKHGVVGLTKTLALELARQKITANAICPGYVLTPLVEAQIPGQMQAHHMDRETVIREVMLDKQPTKEFVTTDQIGALAAFLCTDAASQINGAALPVDGGWTAE